MPPGTWGSVYLLYQSHCLATNQRVSSRALFYEVIKPWRRVLKFRRRSQHTSCQVCEHLRVCMRHSSTFFENAKSADALLGHLSMVWRCRETYWSARQESRNRSGLLTLIIDGFDRSKPALPRWSRGRKPKHSVFERMPRTTVQLNAVIAHGFGVQLFLSEEHSDCGGSYTWECLMQTIDRVWKKCAQEGKPFSRSSLVILKS